MSKVNLSTSVATSMRSRGAAAAGAAGVPGTWATPATGAGAEATGTPEASGVTAGAALSLGDLAVTGCGKKVALWPL